MLRNWLLLFSLCGAALAVSTDSTQGGEGKRTQEEVQFGNQQNKPEGMVDDALAAGYFPSSEKKDADSGEGGDASSSTPSSQVSSSANPNRDESTEDASEEGEEQEERGKSDFHGYKYGGKDAPQISSENSILKSGAFGYPGPVSEYQYYGRGDRLRRSAAIRSAIAKRSSNFNSANRFKRELDREDVLTLLALLAAEQQEYPPRTGMRYDNDYGDYSEIEGAGDDAEEEEDDDDADDNNMAPFPVGPNEDWLRARYLPVQAKRKGAQDVRRRRLPWETNYGPRSRNSRQHGRNGQWGGFPSTGINKRFMVSKRNQGPNAGEDVYSLAQLLGGPRRGFTDYNHPVYRRFML